jgi:hypothetical protein
VTGTSTASHASCYHVSYSLTCAEYDDLLAVARGCCMACKERAAPLCLDHDHELGWWAVRGLVCRSCNQQLRRVDSGERSATARERLPCGCKAGRPPRPDCIPCQSIRLIGEAIGRAWRDAVREMAPLPDWYVRDLGGTT